MACPNASNLNTTQKDVLAQITYVGDSRGFSDQMIQFALKAAFIESSLGLNTGASRPGGDHMGLFQYDTITWNELGHSGDRMSNEAQINAFFDDILKYTERYNALQPADRGNLSLEQYVYLKHHDGNNYTNWNNSPGVNIFNSTCFETDITTQGPDGVNSGGGGINYMFMFVPSWYGYDDLPVGTVTVGPVTPAPGEDGDGEY